MNKTKWFVMVRHNGTGVPMPLVVGGENEWDDSVALFDTEAEADAAGSRSPMGIAAGYEVYPWS